MWEWNSVVDEDDEVPASQSADVGAHQTTKAKKVLEEQEKKAEPQERKERFSTFVSLILIIVYVSVSV